MRELNPRWIRHPGHGFQDRRITTLPILYKNSNVRLCADLLRKDLNSHEQSFYIPLLPAAPKDKGIGP